MHPPYAGMKIVHDQQIQEALERHRLHSEQATPRQGLIRTLGKALARFPIPARQNQGRALSGETLPRGL
jgi:hypothetical protein